MLKMALVAIAEGLRAWRVFQEIRSRRLALDEMERVEDEIEELEDELESYRRAGLHADADKLLTRQVRRATFARGVFDLAEGAGFHIPKRHDIGGSEGGADEG